MSRIGKLPIPLASGVEVSVADGVVTVKGPKGQLDQRVVPHTRIELNEQELVVHRDREHKTARSMHGLMRSLVANMVQGVTVGFSRKLEIHGVGYRAEARSDVLVLNVGYSHPVEMAVPKDLEVRVEGQTQIEVVGTDKQRVGQFAAEVRSVRAPEPYKGKGIRYAGERVRRKVGKAAVGA